MRFLLKLLIFFLVFSIEVRVKAAALQFDPVRCNDLLNTECLVFSRSVGGKLSLENANLYLGRESLVYRDRANIWHFVRGVVKVDVKKKFQLASVVGDFQADRAEFILQEFENKVHLFVLSGGVLPQLRSSEGKVFALTGGYANWYGKINSYGFNDEGLPRPLLWKSFAKQIGFENWYLIIKEKSQIKNKEYDVVENSSQFYLELSQNIAHQKMEREQEVERQFRARQEGEQNIRRLFRKKFEVENLDE